MRHPLGSAFSHVAIAGGLVCCSGQIGVDPDGLLLDAFEARVAQAF